jgi:hypothetical protein
MWIRTEVLNFATSLINLLSQGEVYTYLKSEFKSYLYMPFVILTPVLLRQVLKERLSRVIYQLETKEIEHFFLKNSEDEMAFQLLENLIVSGRENSKYNDEGNNNDSLEAQMVRLRVSMEGVTISSVLRKEYSKFIKNYNLEDIRFLERTFVGKLTSLSNYNRGGSGYSNNKIVSKEYLQLKYLFNALDIVIKDDILEEIDNEFFTSTPKENNTQTNSTNSGNLRNSTSFISKGNSGISSWKPQGKLLCTLYDHEKPETSQCIGVEKLLCLNTDNMSKFLSFASDGRIILWELLANENDLSIEKLASTSIPTGIVYNKAISSIDQNSFASASQNKIECYKVEGSKSNFILQNSFEISGESSDICCLTANYKSKDNKHLIYCNQKGKLNIYDLRLKKSALNYQVGVQRGLVSCMDFSKDDRSLYLGTYGGYLLNYDFRLNTVVESFKYNENTPIIGLKTYLPARGRELDLYSLNVNQNFNNYILLWTAATDHELGLWNLNTSNCDVLMKVNSIQGNDIKPLSMEIPCLYLESLDVHEKSNLDLLYNNLQKFVNNLPKTTNNKFNTNVSSEFYSHSKNRLSKLSNMFDISNTVQVALSPNKTEPSLFNENVPYIISAGNDSTIRLWDISKEGMTSNNSLRKSYLINAPNKIDSCIFTSTFYDSTSIIQSNENSHTKLLKKDLNTFSDYQNYNGVNFHLGVQNEFDESLEVLKYCTKNSDASHKNLISDLAYVNLNSQNTMNTFLLSSSWDGTIKVWK